MEQHTHISIRGLNVWYGAQKALCNVNLDMPDKKIIAIIGPSGCGKTTLLKSLNRLVELQDGIKVTGSVIIDGEDIYGKKTEVTHLRKKMGLLSQRPQPLPMSIYENVAYGPRIHGLKNKEKLDSIVQSRLKEVNLWEEVKDRLYMAASKLSVGQQQRLCLARGLAVEPEVILCDEPTSALDPMSAEIIERKFVELKEKYTIIMVTHSLDQARRIADYLIFIYLGKIIEAGEAHNILTGPKYHKTKQYLSGKLIEEITIEKEIDLVGRGAGEVFKKAEEELSEMKNGGNLKVIIGDEQTAFDLEDMASRAGHIVMEKTCSFKGFEVILQKQAFNYGI